MPLFYLIYPLYQIYLIQKHNKSKNSRQISRNPSLQIRLQKYKQIMSHFPQLSPTFANFPIFTYIYLNIHQPTAKPKRGIMPTDIMPRYYIYQIYLIKQ